MAEISKKKKNWLQLLGPGLLFAGAAVGVSHLVLSTRAGASYGFGLIWIVLLANLLKYPFFEFGPRYASSTGESLLVGYKRMGKGVVAVFVIMTLGTMFTIQAAVTVVAASLANLLFGDVLGLVGWVGALLVICAALLLLGRYSLLDNLMKIIIISLTIITLIVVVLAWDNPPSMAQTFPSGVSGFVFIIMLMGWMPAPLDLSVWHSLWAVEKRKQTSGEFDTKQSLFDFNVGYIGTAILALFFLILGALVMYDPNAEPSFPAKATEFAHSLVNLYTESLIPTLGKEGALIAGYIVAIAAFITMFSTTITCLDALPRAMSKAHILLLEPLDESNDGILDSSQKGVTEVPKAYYWAWLAVLLIGTMFLVGIAIVWQIATMGTFITVATILSFITAPFFAIVNYRLVTKYVSKEAQPATWLRVLAWIGILYLVGFSLAYLYILLA